ncbi:hypothetical protein EB796_013376 [Bugula neritina]|uniref:BTB domain-containing protein n=1 Tax=Bugula neritina TaxID=10212 RepID=A0A7J7JQV5_BUGNE|nr:hypothetical protein EB796_013376 [Bugula neritina]
MPSSGGHDYSTQESSRSGSSTSSVTSSHLDTLSTSSQDSMLPELTQVPWTESDILSTLQKGEFKELCGNISIECLQRLSYLLQRPLIRIAREALRLTCKIVLSPHLYSETSKLASQNTLLYSMSTQNTKLSKNSLCSLSLSVGKHHRWLLEALPVGYVHELAAIYLSSVMETLIEQTARLAFSTNVKEMLESGIFKSPHLHSIYHPSNHLISYNYADTSPVHMQVPSKQKQIERGFMTPSCVSSIPELTDIVSQAMHYWCPKIIKSSQLKWTSSAITTLYYFIKCSQPGCCESRCSSISLTNDRPYSSLPPVIEWVRIAIAFAEHRNDQVIDCDDVKQTARVLLLNADCTARPTSSYPATYESLSAAEAQKKFALSLLASGIPELQKHASKLLTKSDIDCINRQGMTPLMNACNRGEDATALALLRLGASVDICVPSTHRLNAGWTALCFAVSQGHLSMTKMLLEYGCSVDGSATQCGNCSETPLQLACASGQMQIVNLLLKYGADPYQQTLLLPGVEIKNSFNSFTLAASHGHREVLRRLFAETLKLKSSEKLTLAEMLNETASDASSRTPLKCNQQSNTEEENDYMVIENDYFTIEDVYSVGQFSQLKERLSSSCISTLQESLYHAAENGYLDMALEIHGAGLPWTIYTWYMTLSAAHITHRKPIAQSLLKEFNTINLVDNMKLFTECCLPLMFDIFRESKNEMSSRQLAAIFSLLYGPQPLPLLKDVRSHPSLIIDSSYVNSPEHADVCFLVENETFYAHKIVLSSASSTFKNMFANFKNVSMPKIEIRDMDYQVFEGVMRYVYEGYDCTQLTKQTDVKRNKTFTWCCSLLSNRWPKKKM